VVAYWSIRRQVPQLTLRAVLMGGVLGALMSVSNLYTSINWAGFRCSHHGLRTFICNLEQSRVVFPKLSPMSILENNCMQSTASAAGYSTGATIGTALVPFCYYRQARRVAAHARMDHCYGGTGSISSCSMKQTDDQSGEIDFPQWRSRGRNIA